VFGQPSGPQDRTQPRKLEIPFGHAFDKRGGIVVLKRCARVRLVGLRSAIEERAVLGVPDGVGRHEGALRDHSFPVVSPTRSSRYGQAAAEFRGLVERVAETARVETASSARSLGRHTSLPAGTPRPASVSRHVPTPRAQRGRLLTRPRSRTSRRRGPESCPTSGRKST